MAESGRGRKRRRRKRGNIATIIILIAAVIVLVIALWRLVPQMLDYSQSENTYEELAGEVVDLGPDEEQGVEDWNQYDWASVTIDFDALWQINPDVVGWIRFDDTDAVNVDYPILHAADNETYLRMDLYGNTHTAGSIFLEAADSPDLTDVYNIIYGHNMRNGTMFGTLRKYRDNEGFYEENRFFTIYTPRGAFRYEIFGYSEVPDDSDIYMVGFGHDEVYQQLIDRMIANSYYDTGVVPTIDQQTVTLSTCTAAGENYRMVVYGVCVDHKYY